MQYTNICLPEFPWSSQKKKKKVKRKGKSLETNFKILWTRVSLATTPERILQNTLLAVFSLSDSVLV